MLAQRHVNSSVSSAISTSSRESVRSCRSACELKSNITSLTYCVQDLVPDILQQIFVPTMTRSCNLNRMKDAHTADAQAPLSAEATWIDSVSTLHCKCKQVQHADGWVVKGRMSGSCTSVWPVRSTFCCCGRLCAVLHACRRAACCMVSFPLAGLASRISKLKLLGYILSCSLLVDRNYISSITCYTDTSPQTQELLP